MPLFEHIFQKTTKHACFTVDTPRLCWNKHCGGVVTQGRLSSLLHNLRNKKLDIVVLQSSSTTPKGDYNYSL